MSFHAIPKLGRVMNVFITINTDTYSQPYIQQLINHVQVLAIVVLATHGLNQTLLSQQVLAPVVTHLTLSSLPPTTPSTSAPLHYLEEPGQKDLHKSILPSYSPSLLRGDAHVIVIPVHIAGTTYMPPSYHEMDLNYQFCCFMSNFLGSIKPNKSPHDA
jgi:hypothetical protein